jgi:L-ascorbate metabolism protein UlaG (beta-lactamase superfamily)
MALTRRRFLQSTATTAVAFGLPAAWAQDRAAGPGGAAIQLIRNATCVIHYGAATLLLDPWLSDAGAMPPVSNSPNPRPNPLVPLPVPATQLVTGIDATLLTHTHFDHWDPVARERLPKGGTLFVQPADRARVETAGFTNVRPIESSLSWEGISIARTAAQHGRGEMAQRMGAVSGYVLSRPGLPTIYIAADTVWYPAVADAIRTHQPDVIVVNAGEAQFLEGGPIIMGVDDVVSVCQAAPQATVIAVHMEAVNHCVLSRDGLRLGLDRAQVTSRVLIPKDGESVRLS